MMETLAKNYQKKSIRFENERKSITDKIENDSINSGKWERNRKLYHKTTMLNAFVWKIPRLLIEI